MLKKFLLLFLMAYLTPVHSASLLNYPSLNGVWIGEFARKSRIMVFGQPDAQGKGKGILCREYQYYEGRNLCQDFMYDYNKREKNIVFSYKFKKDEDSLSTKVFFNLKVEKQGDLRKLQGYAYLSSDPTHIEVLLTTASPEDHSYLDSDNGDSEFSNSDEDSDTYERDPHASDEDSDAYEGDSDTSTDIPIEETPYLINNPNYGRNQVVFPMHNVPRTYTSRYANLANQTRLRPSWEPQIFGQEHSIENSDSSNEIQLDDLAEGPETSYEVLASQSIPDQSEKTDRWKLFGRFSFRWF